jgi:hypothetical protein
MGKSPSLCQPGQSCFLAKFMPTDIHVNRMAEVLFDVFMYMLKIISNTVLKENINLLVPDAHTGFLSPLQPERTSSQMRLFC